MTWLMLAAAGGDPWWKATLVQILGFALLAGILAKFVFPALRGILGARTKGVEDTFSRLEKDAADAARELSEMKARMGTIDEESKRRHAAAMADAEKTRARTLSDAAATAQASLDKARKEIEIARDKAALELRHEVERLTMEAADHLVKTAVTESVHQKLVDGYLGRIEGAAR